MTTGRWLAVVVVVGAVGYAAGRHTARTPDVAQEEHATEAVAEAVSQESDATVEAAAAAQEERAATVTQDTERVRVVYRERASDGGERSFEVDASSSRLALELQASREEAALLRAELADARAAVRVETREVERQVEVHTPLPNWRVGALVGADLRGPALAYGAQVQRRLWGPVYVGAWGLTTAAAGVGVGLEW